MNHKTLFLQMIGFTLILLSAVACGAPQAAPTATPIPLTTVPSPVPATDARTPVVIDTDMDIVDVMAILYMLQRPDVEVKAITVAGDGLAHCEAGTRHVLGLVAIADAKDARIDRVDSVSARFFNSDEGFLRDLFGALCGWLRPIETLRQE